MPPEQDRDRSATEIYAAEEDGLQAIQQAQMLSLMEMAQRAPKRDVAGIIKQVSEFACLDEQTAVSCFYRLPGGIVGPSIRFAEILSSLWTDSLTMTRLVTVGRTQVVVEGTFIDTQNRRAHKEEAVGQIVDKDGRRYSDDLIRKTIGATASKALRNAIFRSIPSAFYYPALDAASKVAKGKAKDIEVNRRQALQAFMVLGVGQDRIFAALGITSIEQVNHEMVGDLRGTYQAVKAGELDAEDAFPRIKEEPNAPAASAPKATAAPESGTVTKPAAPAEGKEAERNALIREYTLSRMRDPERTLDLLGEEAVRPPASMTNAELQSVVDRLAATVEPDDVTPEEQAQAGEEATDAPSN